MLTVAVDCFASFSQTLVSSMGELLSYPAMGTDEKDKHDEVIENTSFFGGAEGSCFPTELVDDIMIRLPAEILVEKESVSKSWRTYIRRKDFIELHAKCWRSRVGIIGRRFTCDKGNPFSYCCLSFDFKGLSPSINVQTLHLEECVNTIADYNYGSAKVRYAVVSSCDGLLLVQFMNWTSTNIGSWLLICNPVTRYCKLLPRHDSAFWMYCFWAMIYDSNVKRYKVVGLSTSTACPNRCFVLEISGREDEFRAWREIRIPGSIYPDHSINIWPKGFHSSVFVGGKIHFLMDVLEDGSAGSDSWVPSVLSFDVATEQFDYIARFPEIRPIVEHDIHVTSQTAFYTMYSLPGGKFEIWALRDFEHPTPTWVKLRHVIDVSSIYGVFFGFEALGLAGQDIFPVEPLGVLDEERKLVLCFLGKMFVYDMVSGKWHRDMQDEEQLFSFFGGRRADERGHYILHASSLVSWK